MSKTHKSKPYRVGLMKYTWWVIMAWTLILVGLLLRDLATIDQSTRNLAIREARANFQKDEAFRFWAATHGGFYVPTNERTPPNPYLAHIRERDIETPAGLQLTLMNPEYALRQMNEEFAKTNGVVGHITSLQSLRSENAPDDWERLALESFERGETEVFEFAEFEGQPSLRLMQPLFTQEGCLKCHGRQGYAVGDVRGGVSITVPLAAYLAEGKQSKTAHILSYTLIWLLVFGVIIQGSRVAKKNSLERERAEEEVKNSEKKYRLLSEYLAKSNSMKELLLDIITHDLKNPAGVIKGFAQLGLDNDPGNEILEEIDRGTDNLLNVIANATILSKVAIGDEIEKEKLDLTNMINMIIKEFSAHLQYEEMTLDMKMEEELIVTANPIISEVFRNYISNAIKYAKSGKKIIIDTSIENGSIVVNVKDFGKTIEKKDRENIFMRKIQLDKSKGRGLGLAIVKRIAEAHNAKIGVKPNKPKGNNFYIKIPKC